jgi:small subunit ribosomal protein S1
VKVELGDGVFGHCKLTVAEAPEAKSSANVERVDVASVTAMLSAKWKGGGATESKSSSTAEKNTVRAGQIRTFTIANMDAEHKRIQLELAS